MTPGTLDAATLACCQAVVGRLFPWDTNRALELALLKTFCLPSISALLQRTGEFEQRPRKRYDDTGLMLAELVRLGPDSPGGQAVIDYDFTGVAPLEGLTLNARVTDQYYADFASQLAA